MTIERALIGTTDAAAAASVYVEDVFQTYLYNGTGASQTINNGIDLATKGGMVWIKARNIGSSGDNMLSDTARGITNDLSSNRASAQNPDGMVDGITATTSSGFTLGDAYRFNSSGNTFVSWTFRKQPKFFDIVTYTGTGSARTIAHNLGATPGMIIVKRTDTTSVWQVYHNGLTSAANSIQLNLTAAQASATTVWNSTAPTSTVFSVGTDATVNASGGTYVAYLFAASNSGGFGSAGTDSVVTCGSFATGVDSLATIELGWEPQFVITKRINSTGNWFINDAMRGFFATTVSNKLMPNLADAEASNGEAYVTSTGFRVNMQQDSTYIYLAIRRGPMKTPTDATKVFAPVTRTGTGSDTTVSTGFPVDLATTRDRNNAAWMIYFDRLRGTGNFIASQTTNAENTNATTLTKFDAMSTVGYGTDSGNWGVNNSGASMSDYYFRRAPGFFDVVCYTGTGSPANITHNLSVEPNLIITKRRNSTGDWWVYGKTGGFAFLSNSASQQFALNTTNGCYKSSDAGDLSFVTSTTFSTNTGFFGGGYTDISGATYVSYLFATCPGVSKVFSFTGNGSSQTIDCGFAAGARFVLIKRTDAAGDWWVYDSARGIVSAADPALRLNSTAAEVTSADAIDPASSGFIVNQVAATNVNVNNATYIGLAIA